MALNAQREWLVSYDIANPRRLQRIHRQLRNIATPMQYSVFHFLGTAGAAGQLRNDLAEQLDDSTDDLRIYPVPANPQIILLGQPMPDGLAVIDKRAKLLQTLYTACARPR